MKKLFISALTVITLFACDPSVYETMVIHNKSGKELTIFVQNKHLWYHDSSTYAWVNRDIDIRFIQYSDTLIQLEADIPHGGRFYLHEYNDLGYIRFEDSQTANAFLKSYNDTFYLKSHVMARDMHNFDNWHQDVEKETLHSEAKFTFSVARGDIR